MVDNNPTAIPKFRVHVVVAALAIVSAIGHVFGGYATGKRMGDVPYGVGYGVGGAFCTILIGYGLGWLVYRILGRSNLAGNLAFCLVILISNYAHTGRADEDAQRPSQTAALQQESIARPSPAVLAAWEPQPREGL